MACRKLTHGSCKQEASRRLSQPSENGKKLEGPDSGGITWAELMALSGCLDYLECGMGLEEDGEGGVKGSARFPA